MEIQKYNDALFLYVELRRWNVPIKLRAVKCSHISQHSIILCRAFLRDPILALRNDEQEVLREVLLLSLVVHDASLSPKRTEHIYHIVATAICFLLGSNKPSPSCFVRYNVTRGNWLLFCRFYICHIMESGHIENRDTDNVKPQLLAERPEIYSQLGQRYSLCH
jgi:hypothetical protein